MRRHTRIAGGGHGGGHSHNRHELYDAYERGDFQRVAAPIHDDVDWVIYAPLSVFPFAGPRRGAMR